MEIYYLGPINMIFTICSAFFFTVLSKCLFKPEDIFALIFLGGISLAFMLFTMLITAKVLISAFSGIEKKYAKLNLWCTIVWWGLILTDAVLSSKIVLSRMFLYGFVTMFLVLVVWTQIAKWKFFKALEKYHYDIYYKFCTMDMIGNKRFRYLGEEADRILQQDPMPEMKETILREKSCYPVILVQFEIMVFTIVVICTFGMTHPSIVV